jgi:predicted HTH transcriptional regulator
MIRKLSLDEVLELIKQKPEQNIFDWKTDFFIPNNDEKKGEIIKDVTAIANAITLSPGFIVYGVNPNQSDPIIGITNSFDDANLQQLFQGKVNPPIEFIYYEISFGPKTIGVIQITPTQKRPHIISINIGKARDGQIPIRRGSSTDGVKIEDLIEMFYGETSLYFQSVIQKQQLDIQQQQIDLEKYKELKELAAENRQRMLRSLYGLPPDIK